MKLIDEARKLGVKTEDLDEVVHDVASELASSANSGGLEEQLRFLVENLGLDDVRRILHGWRP